MSNTKEEQWEATIHEPFSPVLLETKVPKKFVDIVNKVGDEVLSDDRKSAQWDL